ncbi:hypothetical protein Tco_1203546 [Tanacetum coccineum]
MLGGIWIQSNTEVTVAPEISGKTAREQISPAQNRRPEAAKVLCGKPAPAKVRRLRWELTQVAIEGQGTSSAATESSLGVSTIPQACSPGRDCATRISYTALVLIPKALVNRSQELDFLPVLYRRESVLASEHLDGTDFPGFILLKRKKDSGMDEVLDCFLLDGPLEDLPEATRLQPCLEQLSVPIYHADVNAVVGETSLSLLFLNVHKKHTRARRPQKSTPQLFDQLMVDIVSPSLWYLQTCCEASISSVPPAL